MEQRHANFGIGGYRRQPFTVFRAILIFLRRF
jgi:hypothetical protein